MAIRTSIIIKRDKASLIHVVISRLDKMPYLLTTRIVDLEVLGALAIVFYAVAVPTT